MRRSAAAIVVFAVILVQFSAAGQETEIPPWVGKYPMSMFTRTRTARTVGKGKLSLAVKLQSVNCDEILQNDCYEDLSDTDRFEQLKSVLTAKYGWMENSHVALGIPYLWTDFESPTTDIDSNGIANVFIFNKWRVLRETEVLPAVAFDVWYYFDSGDSEEKLGSSDDSTKLAFQVSKAWKRFNLHLNPAYRWNLDEGCDILEVNVGSYCNINKSMKLGIEYNFTDKEEKGRCHELVPGILLKPSKTSSIKLGAVINVDSDMKYKDDLGVVLKLFKKF